MGKVSEELGSEAAAFIKDECDRLKAENAKFAETATDMLKYAVMTSGAIFAWMSTDGMASGATAPILLGWLAPLGVSLVFGGIAGALWRRTQRKTRYIAKIQEQLFPHPEWVGWERYLIKNPEPRFTGPGALHTISWLGLFAANAFMAMAALGWLGKWPGVGQSVSFLQYAG